MRWWPAVLVMLPLAACGSGPGVTEPEGVDGLTIPTPSPDPRDFVRRVDNPYLPLAPGSRWVYEVAGGATVTVTVGDEPRAVDGVATTVVRERSGTTETERWFAQDRAGNVWIFGEQGTWEAGIDGAQAGVAMLGQPRVGDGYRQGYDEGVAEDHAEVLSIDADVMMGSATYSDAIQTAEISVLEPGTSDLAYYAEGVGLVLVESQAGTTERALVEYTPG